MIASVSGRGICAIVPRPSSDVRVTSPPSSRIIVRTASMPTPRPEMSLVTSAVEKPGRKSSSAAPLPSSVRPASAVIRPRSTARLPTLTGSMPRPSSRTSMTTLPPAWRGGGSGGPGLGSFAAGGAGGDLEGAGLRLARGEALLRRLEAVVERVADEVDERVAERLDDRAVELGVLADELELDVLGELARQVADEAREAHEDRVDRDHADLHDHGLEGLRGARELLHRLAEAGFTGVRGERLDERAVDDELAHPVHERVEALGVDADGRGGLLVRRGAFGSGGRRPCRGRLGDRLGRGGGGRVE